MDANQINGIYNTASQRVAATYQRMLSQFLPVLPEGLNAVQQAKMRGAQEDLHAYFTSKKYQVKVEIGRMFSWTVKYQGKKKIKATPLFQIDFDERLLHRMRAGIKCASAQRIVPLLPNQSQALQDDFSQRSFTCGNCHWCDNQKSFGPVDYEYRGEKREFRYQSVHG
jgi:hypothetical protein